MYAIAVATAPFRSRIDMETESTKIIKATSATVAQVMGPVIVPQMRIDRRKEFHTVIAGCTTKICVGRYAK